jgi:simple sugar transport system ATP-binding protein
VGDLHLGTEPLLRTKKIDKWFEKVHAVREVDFEIYPGEIVLLIGDNGAGKSTLIKMLAGVFQSTHGKIFFEGKEAKISSVDDARKLGIETVYQERAIVGSISVAKNIFLGREPGWTFGPLRIVNSNLMKKMAAKAVQEELGLRISSMDQEARFCSGGEQQGIAIARSILFKNKLVILDEPTTALSIAGIREVQDFIKEMGKKGIAVIVISHSLASIYPVCDRIVVLSRGKKIFDKSKNETSLNECERLCLE